MFLTHKVISNTVLNRKFNLIKLRSLNPDLFAFKAGQFVSVKVGDNIFRSYSISSGPSQLPHWDIFVDITPGGPGTTYLKSLKRNQTIETSKPIGNFLLNKRFKNYIFGATGCGIAPFVPMIRELIQTKGKNTVLIWGLRSENDIPRINFFKTHKKAGQYLFPNIILSKPTKKWSGNTGHVNSHIIKACLDLPKSNTCIYLSGSNDFVISIKKQLLKLKRPSRVIFHEACY